MSLFAKKPKEVPQAIVRPTVDALPDAARWMAALDPSGLIPCVTGWAEDGLWPERAPKGNQDSERLWTAAVGLALKRRAKAVSFLKLEAAPADGAFLCYWPESTSATGVAEIESRGFFDVECVPISDCWVGWIPSEFGHMFDKYDNGGLLLSWVPTPWLRRVDLGVEANAEECIAWLTHELVPGLAKTLVGFELDIPRAKDLKAMGLARSNL